MNKFYALPLVSVLALAIATASQADLVIKAGQVIGRDGQIYDGMSPETEQALRAQLEAGETKVGVLNNNLYIMNDDVVTTVPLVQLRGKQSDERLELVKEAYRAELRESLIDDAVAKLESSQLESQDGRIDDELSRSESELEDRMDGMDDDIEDSLRENEREIEGRLEELDDDIEDSLREHEREIEDHLDELDDEIEDSLREQEREIEQHINEVENHIEREVESRDSHHDSDDHDDDD